MTGDVWEPPDIPQPHRRAQDGKNEGQPIRPCTMRLTDDIGTDKKTWYGERQGGVKGSFGHVLWTVTCTGCESDLSALLTTADSQWVRVVAWHWVNRTAGGFAAASN